MAQLNKLSIVIADDHPVFRVGLREIIESESGFKVVGEAGDGEQALEMITKIHPAIAILDVSMPKLDGLALARKLVAQEPAVGVILVTMYRERKLFTEALEAGVKGYVLKDSAATDIISCIKAVAAGQNYASPELTTYLVNRVRQGEAGGAPRSDLKGLTTTELRILSLLADYKTSKEIAQELFISPRTVDTHRNNICQKLDIHGSHALMKFALAHKDLLSQELTTT
jgi:DNA-binding NarL/FixJ family response regulator